MKKLILFTTFVCVALMLQAQKDVTRFLGIPVDGTKSEMIQKLKDKGYVYNPESELLEGEFNGRDVYICIVTNNRKVWRIGVWDAHRVNETQIRIRFNNLLQQFNNNKKYYSWPDSVILKYTIPQDEDISYEMSVNHKSYEMAFYQKDSYYLKLEMELDSLKNSKTTSAEDVIQLLQKQIEILEEQKKQFEILKEQFSRSMENLVWFTINEYNGEYYICIFYDNKYNKANGDDL